MLRKQFGTALALIAALSACGGGGGGGNSSAPTPPTGVTPTPTPSPTASACSLRSRQDWVAAQMREWYLFPETLPTSLSPASFSTVQAYIDALTATARSQGRDRFFTYVTSIAEENAFFASGSSAGFGFRLTVDAADRLLIVETFEGTPALAAGIDRGTEILAIGASEATLRTIPQLFAAGQSGVDEALGPPTVGTTRVFQIRDASGTRNVTVTKADYEIAPVSSRYGAQVIDDGGKRVGYVNLRTFISSADPALRSAFASFRAQGITDVIVDFRYNGGGLISIAELMGDLLGGNRSPAEVFSYTTFRPEKAEFNETRLFQPQAQSVSPMKVAFIGTDGTASASELVINAFTPYLRANAALIGTDTFGKPVGQIGLDRAQCDDRLRVVALATQNVERRGNYYNGLASEVAASCQAGDDLTRPMGDPREASTRQALDFLAGRSCTPISAGISAQSARTTAAPRRELLTPKRPSTVQREVPGTF